jgi:DNA-binding beta-propeller fold protein YncE
VTPVLYDPYDVAWGPNPSGELYVADPLNAAYNLVGVGGLVYTLPVSTVASQTEGVAIDQSTLCNGGPCIYAADYFNSRVVVLDQNDGAVVRSYDGLQYPYGVAVNAAGTTLVVSDGTAGGGQVQEFSGGTYLQSFESYYFTSGTQSFNTVKRIAMDSSGNIYVLDLTTTGNYTNLVELSPSGETLAVYSGAFGKNFIYAEGVAVDTSGNIYVSDSGWGRVLKYTP